MVIQHVQNIGLLSPLGVAVTQTQRDNDGNGLFNEIKPGQGRHDNWQEKNELMREKQQQYDKDIEHKGA